MSATSTLRARYCQIFDNNSIRVVVFLGISSIIFKNLKYGIHQNYQIRDETMEKGLPVREFPSDPSLVNQLFENLPSRGCHNNNNSSYQTMVVSRYEGAEYIHTESGMVSKRPAHFLAMPSYNHNYTEAGYDFVHGGVALFTSALLGGERPPAIYDCNIVYVPGGCKSGEGSKSSFNIKKSGRNIMELGGTTVFIWQFWGEAYYHSLVEDLPRLAYVLPYLRRISQEQQEKAVILAPAILINGGKREVLSRLLGLDDTNTWIEWKQYDPNQVYFCERLLVPTGTRCGRAQPGAVQTLQAALDDASVLQPVLETLSNLMQLGKEGGRKRVVVLQKRLNSRKLLNHEKLLSALRKELNSSVVVEFDGTEHLLDTVALHRIADVVVGPHGAGLANLIWTARGSAAMVELHPGEGNYNGGTNPCHQYTANAAGLRTCLIQHNDGSNFGDTETNITQVVAAVKEFLQYL